MARARASKGLLLPPRAMPNYSEERRAKWLADADANFVQPAPANKLIYSVIPCFGTRYDQMDADVHGGLTYSDDRLHSKYAKTIQTPGKTWWFGFDCAHEGDRCPAWETAEDGEYKPISYVEEECTRLAKQLAEMGLDNTLAAW